MAKQKVVMRVSMKNDKKTRKALSIAATIPGVDYVGLEGAEKDQIAVSGEGIDSVELTCLLRKRIGHTEIMSVAQIEEKKPDKPPVNKEKPVLIEYPCLPHPYPVQLMPMQMHVVHEDPYYSCSIL